MCREHTYALCAERVRMLPALEHLVLKVQSTLFSKYTCSQRGSFAPAYAFAPRTSRLCVHTCVCTYAL